MGFDRLRPASTGVRAEDGRPYTDNVRLVNDAGETIRVLNDSAPGVSMFIRNNLGAANAWTNGMTVPGANGAGVLERVMNFASIESRV